MTKDGRMALPPWLCKKLNILGLKYCSTCDEIKEHRYFISKPEGGHKSQCRPCHSARNKRYYHEEGGAKTMRGAGLVRRYGDVLTKEQVQEFVTTPSGYCEACGGFFSMLCIDHEHSTGRFRGRLCHACNLTLGQAKDSPEILTGLLNYIFRYKQRHEET